MLKIFLENEDITNFSPEKIGIMVGTVYQSPDDQLFAMTVADEVGFALENQGLESNYIREQVSETLRLVGLGGFESYSIHQLSGGQRQRLALASILITKPRLLILDEPVSQMNPQGVQDFLNLLLKLNREEKIAILMVEHRVNELAGYFKRLAVMQQGKIIYDGATEDAWSLLDGKEDVGLREPQNVKLCRALELSALSSVHQKVVSLITQVIDLSQFTAGYDNGTYTVSAPTGVTATVNGSKMTVKLADNFGGVGYIKFTLKDKEGDSFGRYIGVTQQLAASATTPTSPPFPPESKHYPTKCQHQSLTKHFPVSHYQIRESHYSR